MSAALVFIPVLQFSLIACDYNASVKLTQSGKLMNSGVVFFSSSFSSIACTKRAARPS